MGENNLQINVEIDEGYTTVVPNGDIDLSKSADLRVVFQHTEFDHDDDIEALCGALRLSLQQFSPTRHGEDKASLMMKRAHAHQHLI